MPSDYGQADPSTSLAAFIDEGCSTGGVLQFAADLSNNLIGKMGSIISDCD